ncbi:RNA-binding protein 26 [Ischnura elegans]|uniref:RNA-binding protein 26 n=1 Tax=Ischnura elegans TaxID=197161 RepID=UPI001ED8B26E|nr:RNA-binding protein 26 [Ischnura elegans]
MIIENPEAFKSWLTTILEPLCDADPAALAKYVFALVKKDKPIADLRESMIDQLDVFLQQETLKFVDLLFKTLETQSYVDSKACVVKTEPIISNAPAISNLSSSALAPSQMLTMPLILPTPASGSMSRAIPSNIGATAPVKKEPVDTAIMRSHRKSDSEKEDKGLGRSGRSRHRSPLSPPLRRSRSRSWEHSSSSHRSRGRERERERDRGRAGWRGGMEEERRGRKMSPGRRYGRDRRSSWSRSKSPRRGDVGSRSSSRSPRHGHTRSSGGSGRGGGYRSRSCSPAQPHLSTNRSSLSPRSRSHTPSGQGPGLSHNRSRSRSHSGERIRDSKKEPLSGAGTPTQDSNHGDVDMRLTTTSQSIQSVVSAAPPPPGVVPTGIASVVPVVTPSQTGIPPGAAGPGVPGVAAPQQTPSVPPMGVDGIGAPEYLPKRRCRDFDEKGYCMRGDLCPYDHGNDPVVLENVAIGRVLSYGAAGTTRVPPQHPPPLPPNTPPHPPPPPPPPPPVVVGASLSHPPPPPQVVTGPHHPRGMMGPHVGRPHLHHHPPHHPVGGMVHPRGNMEYNPDAPSMEPRVSWGRPQFRGPPPGMRGGMRHVVPRQTNYGGGGGNLAGNASGGQQQHIPQRELISVPVSDNAHLLQPHKHPIADPPQPSFTSYKRPRLDNNGPYIPSVEEPELELECDVGAGKRKAGFDYSRLGPRKNNPNNCSLELKKVPRGLNNIAHLNNHFAKFGKIVNIQVSFEGDPEAALITFSSHAEANAAYRSTEAVLNNRFIKVFWHNKKDEGKQENVPPPRPSVKERLGSVMMMPNPTKVLNVLQPKATPLVPSAPPSALSLPPPLENEKVIMSGNNLTKTVYIPTALKKTTDVVVVSVAQENIKAQAAAAIKKSQEMLAAKEAWKKKQEETRKEAIKLTADLRKRKQELVEKQLAQQKILIEKLEKGNIAANSGNASAAGLLRPGEREAILKTVKSLQESIEAIRKDLAASGPPANTNNATSVQNRKTKEEAQKEILDAELDLYTRQQEGGDTSDLQRKVAELKMEAHSLGILGVGSHATLVPGIRRGTGLIRARGRGSIRSRVAVSRGGFRGRGRGHHSHLVLSSQHHLHHAHTSVDHRPTKILVSGHEADEKQEVLAHFAQFGELVDYASDESTPSLVINYRTRKEAEVALLQGRVFQDRLLSLTWWSEGGNSTGEGNGTEVSPGRQSGVGRGVADGEEGEEEEEEENADVEEEEEGGVDVLLPDEEEEEEEDGEDRSWRR